MSISTRQKHRILILIALVILVYIASFYQAPPENVIYDESDISELFTDKRSDEQIHVTALVTRLLPDDTKGSAHQRFIVTLSNGMSLLVAHNIDLAPRINALNVGDEIELFGEYEWNKQGGVVHWTHHDPSNKHIHGWIKYQGQLYQ
ncbi:hypothetical protein LCGC14_0774020 [marine sediment metagenome]|uniref:DUF3465 domain-containing protein n=1 Tax=marine sediment metagenome TaxID=412755 RepID=A0A0F9T4F5_9ZZZZ|nr:DUF3465 domain-containing protein [Methylophaga aminisulfidivorans]